MPSPTNKRIDVLLIATSILGGLLLFWPLFANAESIRSWQNIGAPLLTVMLIPAMIALAVSEVIGKNFNTRQLAILAVITAVAAAVRPLGAGVAGIEPLWIIVIIAGSALGPTSGFVVGSASIATSSLFTGSIGPWLPYQMLMGAWIGAGAGLVSYSKKKNVALLALYALFSTFFFGWLMNLWFWPTSVGLAQDVAFNPATSPADRFSAWIHFSLISSVGFDIPRALFTAIGVALAAPSLLKTIRRANRRAVITPHKP
ncbi:MAG: hypothetical protein RL410_465 [Actinomycetota bacterium]|jgi:energy-coupling factor transport system substrate-specific component